MIRLKAETFNLLDGSVEGLQKAVQQAVELEHATIPTYLYALYSLIPGKNDQIADLILSVVKEEMLHMTLACNILNSIGGSPAIDSQDFVPIYPGPLPGSVEGDLIVPLKPFSLELVEKVFMTIEGPEDPKHFPVKAEALLATAKPLTIGQFYGSIKQQIIDLSAATNIFTGEPRLQVKRGFPASELIVVNDVASASKAIETIVEQGEGTTKSPLDAQGELAHYYRFAEIFNQKSLIADPAEPLGYAYAGAPIPFDPNGVFPVIENPKSAVYSTGSAAANANRTFNYTYTSLLKTLHLVFNGHAEQFTAAIGLMESLKQQAVTMMSSVPASDGLSAGPSFEYNAISA